MAVPSPMLATPGRPPADAHPHRWAIEMKYDGQRGLARCTGGRWRLYSRTGTDISSLGVARSRERSW